MMIYNLLGMMIYAFGFIGMVVCCKGAVTLCGINENGNENERYRGDEVDNFYDIDIDEDETLPPKYEDAINIPLLNDD